MSEWKKVPLEDIVRDGLIELGRGNIISSIDMQNNKGSYPIYSSSARNNGEMGRYGDYIWAFGDF